MSSLKEIEHLIGAISADLTLVGGLSCDAGLRGGLSVPDDYGLYSGEYEVIPKAFESQTIPTTNKLLRKDISIKEIPYFETHNDKGTTVYIAKEVWQ